MTNRILGRVPVNPEQFFFWCGGSDKDGAARDYMRYLACLFKMTDVKHGHAHRFRDTFAVELLLAGVPLERVSVLLRHSSVKITEKHYAPMGTRATKRQ